MECWFDCRDSFVASICCVWKHSRRANEVKKGWGGGEEDLVLIVFIRTLAYLIGAPSERSWPQVKPYERIFQVGKKKKKEEMMFSF